MKKIFSTLLLFLSCISLGWADQLIVEPDQGRAPLLSLIEQAHSSIKLTVYGLTDPAFIKALQTAKMRNKSVQVILEPHPFHAYEENTYAIQELQKQAIDLKLPNPNFKFVHQKTLLIDNLKAAIMTFNLTKSTFKNERNFALIITDPNEINEINNVFLADTMHQPITVKHPNLVWSPNTSRSKIRSLLNQSQQSLRIYMQNLSDYSMVGELAKLAKEGKNIDILTSKSSLHKGRGKLTYLSKAGVNIRVSDDYMIHAKVILVDRQRALIGSINLTQTSLDQNRELSILTKDKAVLSKLSDTFENDWQHATPYQYHFNANANETKSSFHRARIKRILEFLQ